MAKIMSAYNDGLIIQQIKEGITIKGDSLYFYSPKTNWDEAARIAKIYGGHLVYINDKTEEEFIDTTYASKLKGHEGEWSEQYLWTGTTGDKSGATNWGDERAEYMRWNGPGGLQYLPGRFDSPVVIDNPENGLLQIMRMN